MLTVYGIKNCDSVKKALKWLNANNLPYSFLDFKTTPPTIDLIDVWATEANWTKLLNKHSKTYRELSTEEKAVSSREDAIALLLKYPLLVKRPVIVQEQMTLIGFDETAYNEQLLK